MRTPEQAIDVIHGRFGSHPRHRTPHAKGVWAKGVFTASAEADGSIVVFDPLRLTDGIERSDDPVLLFRLKAYSVSADLRSR